MNLRCVASVLLAITCSFCFAEDKYAVASGNWNGAIWALTPNGAPGSATTPGAGDNVFTNGFSINVNTSATIDNLLIRNNVVDGLYTTAVTTRTLTILGVMVSVNGAADPEAAKPTVAVIENDGNLLLRFTGALGEEAVIRSWSFSAPIRRITFDPAAGGVVTTLRTEAPINGQLATGGEFLTTTMIVNSGIFSPGANIGQNSTSATITVASGATLEISDANISGDGITETSRFNRFTINGTVTTTNTHYFNTNNITLNTLGRININASGSNQTQGWWFQGTNPQGTVELFGTVAYGASADQTLFTMSYNNLELGGSGTKTVFAAGSLNLAGNLTFANSGITLTSSQLVTFNGNGPQEISGGGTVNLNGGLTINKTDGTFTLNQNINLQGQLSVANGSFQSGTNTTLFITGNSTFINNAPNLFNLQISSGTLTAAGTINIAGTFTNNGTYDSDDSGTISFNGTSNQFVQGTTTTFYNLTKSNSSNLTLSVPANVANVLTMQGGTLASNGNLTLLSTATNDAKVAQITSGSITGVVNVQRYLPTGNNLRRYRYLSSPFTDATVSGWKNDFPITGTFSDPSTQAEWPSIANINSASPSFFVYNELNAAASVDSRYESYPPNGTSSASASLQNGRGYAAFIRQTSPITIVLSGSLKTGNANVTVTNKAGNATNDGWNLVGNPYAAPIDWDLVDTTTPGLSSQIALKDNTGRVTVAGNYVYYTQNGVGTTGFNGIIPSGQAFWVRRTNVGSGTLIFEENDKITNTSGTFVRQRTFANLLRVEVKSTTLADELVIYFNEQATDNVDERYDANKLRNDVINLSSLAANGEKLAINSLSALDCSKEVTLNLEMFPQAVQGSYSLSFKELSTFRSDAKITLVDAFTGTTKVIDSENAAYQFNITGEPGTSSPNRFKILFEVPPVKSDVGLRTSDVCTGSSAAIELTGAQPGVEYFLLVNGNRSNIKVAGNTSSLDLTVPSTLLTQQENTIEFEAVRGNCAPVLLDEKPIIGVKTIPAINSTTNASICGEGKVVLQAGASEPGVTYRWYEEVNSTQAIGNATAATFETPVISKTRTYFVAASNSLGCEGERKPVVAEVVLLDPVEIEQSNLVLTSTYNEGNQWYIDGVLIENATSPQITADKTGNYGVTVTKSGCTTSATRYMIVLSTEGENLAGISVFPNPVADIVRVRAPEDSKLSATVYNGMGQSIGVIKFSNYSGYIEGDFDLRKNGAGIYFIKISKDNTVLDYKLVKQ